MRFGMMRASKNSSLRPRRTNASSIAVRERRALRRVISAVDRRCCQYISVGDAEAWPFSVSARLASCRRLHLRPYAGPGKVGVVQKDLSWSSKKFDLNRFNVTPFFALLHASRRALQDIRARRTSASDNYYRVLQ
jgi:hypothetical protein